MKAKFVKSEGYCLEAQIEVEGQVLHVMDEFGGGDCKEGDILDIQLSAGLLYEDEEWESMFGGNPAKKKALVHENGWCYRAYGVVSQIKPEVMVDVGFVELEGPVRSSDQRLVGESIAFTITRLDAYAS